MKRNITVRIALLLSYAIFLALSWIFAFDPGKEISHNFATFSIEMLKLLPFAFILIGLFEVWVSRETVEKHFGERSGIRGYIWAILLAGTSVGGAYVAFPVAYALYRKGAKLSVILAYVSSSAVCRIPMAIFEASFLGIKFTAIRFLVSLPLIIVASTLLGNYMTKKKYAVPKRQ